MNEKYNDRIALAIYLVMFFSVAFGELIAYDKSQINYHDYSSVVLGLAGWFGVYMYSQRIINRNLFWQFACIGLTIFALSAIKQFLTSYNQLPLFIGGLPLFFVGHLRLLVFLFYRKYPNSPKNPTVIFSSKIRAFYNNQGYVPRVKDKLFSSCLFFGFIGFPFGCIILLG